MPHKLTFLNWRHNVKTPRILAFAKAAQRPQEKQSMKHALLTMLISALIPALAWAAEPLTRSDVENFKVAIETMQAKSDEIPDIKEQMEILGPVQAMGMMSDRFDEMNIIYL